MPLLPALQVLARKPRHRGRRLQPHQTPMANPTSLIERYCQEDKATGHKAHSPVTPPTKGDTTAWAVTETAHGIHLLPGTRVLHPQAPGSEWGQAHSAGTNGTGASMEPSPPKPSFRKGLPQCKPRTSQPEVVNS